ncbi:fimbrial protein [Bordetella petrii]|nr:fimbrial protein [Bordetella petrii]
MPHPTVSSLSFFFAIAAASSWIRTRPRIQRTTFRWRAWALALASIIAALLIPATASAEPWLLQCQLKPEPGKFRFNVPSSLTINPALPVGTLIGTYYAYAGVNQFQAACNGQGISAEHAGYLDMFFPGPVSDIANGAIRIAGTNLGMRFVGYTGGPSYESGGYSIQNTSLFTLQKWVRNESSSQNAYTGATMILQIVTMGSVASGEVISGGIIGRVQASQIEDISNPGTALKYYDIELSNDISFTLQTCEVANLTVELGTHNLVGGPGATTPATDFSVHLTSCPTGIPIYYRVDPTTSIVPPQAGGGQGSSLMTLDSTSSASGVGIQLLYENGQGHPLGTKITLTSNGLSTPDTNIWLKARYMQMAPSVTPGTANASAIVTVMYQ